ncbi:hypothetical protein [Nocardia nepalensis]|uniref:ATP dependent DNA ligase n=1 Tax=Nocardia nepalensis TaxID=3375448 RepID=UPI003B6853A3
MPDSGGKLVYIGTAGTGFTRVMLDDLEAKLTPLQRDTASAVGGASIGGVVWVEPRYVGEVAFTEWTREGILRHPSWRGLRPDKRPDHVQRENAPRDT